MNSKFVRELYDRYNNELTIFIKSMLYSHKTQDTDDCLQNLYLAALEAEGLDKHENIRGWLFVTAKNFAQRMNVTYLKTRKNKVELNANTKISQNIENKVIEDLEYIRMKNDGYIEKAKEKFTFNEEIFYKLKYEQKLSVKEISEKMNISENSVYTRDFRLKEKTKKFFCNV